ncbi:MAG: cytochrome P450 [Ardenticatenaceae bacterium]
MRPIAPPKRIHNHWLLGDLKDFQEQPLSMLLDIADNCRPVTQVRFAHVPQIVITHPDGARHVLQKNNRNYIKEQQFMEVTRTALLSGDDLFTSDGDEWLRRRRLMQPAFHRKIVAQFGDLITAETERMFSTWRSGQPVEIEQAMMDVTMGIIGRTMLSQNILDDHPQLYHAFTTVSDRIIERATTISGRMTPLFLPTAKNRAYKNALAVIREILADAVRERQAQAIAERPDDLLTMLMAAQDEESGTTLSTKQIMDEMFGIVTAGHETSAVTLAWLFHALAENPDVEATLHAELDTVLNGRPPTVADLPQLPYLQQVVNETMRRYPAAYVTTRLSLSEDEVLCYHIPANSIVIINIYGLHHHTDYWSEPHLFRPERFAPQNQENITKFTFLPFGNGPRKCIGEPLARLEMQLIVATIAQRFRLRLDPTRQAKLVAKFTLRAKDGVFLIPEQR